MGICCARPVPYPMRRPTSLKRYFHCYSETNGLASRVEEIDMRFLLLTAFVRNHTWTSFRQVSGRLPAPTLVWIGSCRADLAYFMLKAVCADGTFRKNVGISH